MTASLSRQCILLRLIRVQLLPYHARYGIQGLRLPNERSVLWACPLFLEFLELK